MGSVNSGAKRGCGSDTDAILPVKAKRPETIQYFYNYLQNIYDGDWLI